MDWIDEQLEKLMRRLERTDLKWSLILYIGIAVVSALLAAILTAQICSSWMEVLMMPYSQEEVIRGFDQKGNQVFFRGETGYHELPRSVTVGVAILQIIGNCSMVVYALAGVFLVARFYYKKKLNPPIQILLREAEKIGNNELDHPCYYDSPDEMGRVCNAVDQMRIQLAERQGKIWEQMEEQRRLNAAFAHDMRTPLTVLHGYVDLLSMYQDSGQISQEKLQEILEMMDGQVYRLEEYANTMKKIHGLDEREVQKKKRTLGEIFGRLQETVDILNHTQDICLEMDAMEEKEQQVAADISMILEVADNLISNALRYAKSRIQIRLLYEKEAERLVLYVWDDGRGFTGEELKMAVQPYYGEEKGEGNHFGIGLSIAKTLCEKQGGSLSLSNSMQGGAIVCSTFQCEKF